MLLKTPRCPAKLISSPSGPCTIETFGVSVSRSSNLRPRTGRLPTERSSMVVEVCALAVSTVWTAETVMVSETPETFILRSRLRARGVHGLDGRDGDGLGDARDLH